MKKCETTKVPNICLCLADSNAIETSALKSQTHTTVWKSIEFRVHLEVYSRSMTSPPSGPHCVIVLNSSFNCSIGVRDLLSDVISTVILFRLICAAISASADHGNATSTNLIKDHFARTICRAIKLALDKLESMTIRRIRHYFWDCKIQIRRELKIMGLKTHKQCLKLITA